MGAHAWILDLGEDDVRPLLDLPPGTLPAEMSGCPGPPALVQRSEIEAERGERRGSGAGGGVEDPRERPAPRGVLQ